MEVFFLSHSPCFDVVVFSWVSGWLDGGEHIIATCLPFECIINSLMSRISFLILWL